MGWGRPVVVCRGCGVMGTAGWIGVGPGAEMVGCKDAYIIRGCKFVQGHQEEAHLIRQHLDSSGIPLEGHVDVVGGFYQNPIPNLR